MRICLIIIAYATIFFSQDSIAQNVGIGINAPTYKLHVAAATNSFRIEGSPSPVGIAMSIGGYGDIQVDKPGFAGERFTIRGNGNIGIGTSIPGFPLSFQNSLGDKISLWGSSGVHYGFGIQNSLLQIHTDGIAADIAFGYGSSNLFTERMRIKGNGNVGIGTNIPSATLDVVGTIQSTSVITNNVTIVSGGQPSDFLIKTDVTGNVGFRKGHNGLSLNYIIALQGVFPSQSAPFQGGQTYIGEVKLFSGNAAPFGWAICNGQTLPVAGNETLFSIIGTTYGGNGVNNFNLPDLRDRASIGVGTNWTLGENSN